MPANITYIRPRWFAAGNSPPVEGAVLTVVDGKIAAVQSGRAPRAVDWELADCLVCPALVNAHTHLELSHHRTPRGEPGQSLPDWLTGVIASRAGAPQLIDAKGIYQQSLQECLAAGTATVVDIVQSDWDPNWVAQPPLQLHALCELRGFSPQRADSLSSSANGFLTRSVQVHSAHRQSAPLYLGLSPHAPYSISLEALTRVVNENPCTLFAMHLAESREELEFLASGEGPFRNLLEQLGAWDAAFLLQRRTILDYLRVLARAKQSLVIHGNYLTDEEMEFIGKHRDSMAVVYCPRTHAFFRHDAYPWERLKQHGVRVLLGTDSRASSPDLSVLNELRFAASHISPDQLLAACTTDAAGTVDTALTLGDLSTNTHPRLGSTIENWMVLGPAASAANPWDILLDPNAPVSALFCRGMLAYSNSSCNVPPNCVM